MWAAGSSGVPWWSACAFEEMGTCAGSLGAPRFLETAVWSAGPRGWQAGLKAEGRFWGALLPAALVCWRRAGREAVGGPRTRVCWGGAPGCISGWSLGLDTHMHPGLHVICKIELALGPPKGSSGSV